MKSLVTKLVGTGLVAGALMLAQTTQPAPEPTQGATGHRAHRGFRHAFRALNLTDDQKTQAKQIFQTGRTSAQPIAAQLKEARQALAAAAKSNASDAEIDRLSANVGNLSSQLTAIRTKTFAKFYAILTPEQKDKAGSAMNGRMRPARFSHRVPNGGVDQTVQQ